MKKYKIAVLDDYQNVALESADDLLIALEAAQAGATLVTENARDFARWKSLLASTGKTLKLFEPSKRKEFARG
jgi:hypothetical protein